MHKSLSSCIIAQLCHLITRTSSSFARKLYLISSNLIFSKKFLQLECHLFNLEFVNVTGCMSVQRIVADFIPRYACHFPTALEAAAKGVINMHNWSLAMIKKGEDYDGIAFETAKACILGLADVCCAASSVAPTSSVIRGIRSAVFQDVLTFSVSIFDGNDIFHMVDKNFPRMQDSPEVFSELKQNILDQDESPLTKLSKLCALCLIWIFFCCPKYFLAACLDLLGSTAKEEATKGGQYFLSQMTSRLDDDVVHLLDRANDVPKSCTASTGTSIRSNEVPNELSTDKSHVLKGDASVQYSCLLMLVLLHLFHW